MNIAYKHSTTTEMKPMRNAFILIFISTNLYVALYLNLDLAINLINQNISFLIIGGLFLLNKIYWIFESNKQMNSNGILFKSLKYFLLEANTIFNLLLYMINPNKIHVVFSIASILLMLVSILREKD